MKKIVLLFCILSYTTVSAQLFAPAFDLFSSKEVAYINLEDGTKLECVITSVTQKNGLIQSISLVPAGKNKKMSIKAEVISSMYMPISNFSKLNNSINRAFSKHVLNKGINTEMINQGYAYFEKTKVTNNAEVKELLLQVLNPTFSEKIKVYNIPLAKQAMSTEVAGITITHDENKSYFIKVGEATAIKLRKKNYDEAYAALYKDCPALVQKLKDDHRWAKFDEHLWAYTTECN